MSRLDEYFAKVNRGSQTTSSVSASGEKPASNMDAYFAKAGKPVRTNPLNLYTEALKASQGQSTMQTPYADAAAQTKQSGTQNLYAQAAENAKKSGNAAKGTSVVFNSVYGKADDRASSAGSGKYAGILKASDYTELSKGAESKRKLFGDARYDYINNIGNFRAQSDVQQAQGRGQDYGKYAFMTDDEIGVYNYLYATQGKKAANAFLSDLEPELDKQWYTGTNRATTEALGKNAATRTLASAMTVAAQPARTITSMIAMADDAVRTAKGQEINPYSKWRQASNITQELRADTSQHIEEANPGMGGKVGSFVYNTAMSAADSAMNALVAKGIGEAVGLTGDTLMKATNILGSALMSSEAASLSIAESKEKGYSNAGALALGLTRGAIEYASEAVGGEWVIRKIKANPLSFVKSMALTMIPEGMEEVMSDAANGVVNLAIDAAFGTEESGIPRMLEYYRTSGTDWQKKHAELATVLAVLGQEGLSFLGGALATLGSSGVQYSTNRANINQTAERLDTTPKNVVQMMQDAQTENPGVIYALAELTDAENADDLRQKIGTKEDMKRAAEYLTKQMEAGGHSGTQEGVYTAGVQNAPVGAQRAQNEGISTTPAAAINIQEGMNNGQSTYQGRENGSYDLRTGGQAAAEGGTQALARDRAEIPGGVGADAQADLRQVTPAQLGIRNGGTEAVTVVDVRKLGGDAARAYNLLAANNIEPVAVRGAIQVNNGYANAYTESGKVFFRVDAVDSRGNAISPEALVRHELFHNYISEEVLQASDEVIRESMTAEEYDAMYESYRDAYASIYDFENMSEDEIERLLTEEIAADAYAGLNWFSGDAPVQEAVRAETERNAPARRAEARQETTGPPGKATAAGIGARTADSAALRRAEALEKSGTDNETIRQETGWYRGMDGQWRFEIDDSGATFSRTGEAQYSADNADYARYTQLMERLRARENLGAGQRFVPNKSSGEVYRDLMGKGKSEVKVQMTGFLKGTPKESTFKVEVKPTPIGGYYEATIFRDGHKADTLVRALKETAARDAAEEVITMANKDFSEENYQRAKKFEAEKAADEDARIAELFGDPEQLDSTEPSPKSSDAAETENTAAGTTINATTEKVTSEVIKAERNFREDFEKITSGAMRMFVNAGDTVRRIAKATGSKSLEGYYFNAGAYSQRAGNWIAKGGARTDIDGHRIGASLADTLAPMRKNETKYRDFQLYLLHMHNVDRMKYDNSGELERIKENLRWVKEKYPELRELSNEELRRIANSDSDSSVVRQAAHEIYLAAHNGEAPSLTSVAEGATYALELERQRAIVEKQGLKPVFGYDVTADDSQTAAQLLEAKNPEFKEWAKEVYKYSDDLIRYRVEAGLITPEFANALKKRYPHYIPTFREEGTNSKRARRARRNGGIVVSNAIGRAVGSDGVLLPLHTALSRKTVSTMRNAGLNQFGLALVREYDGNTKAAEKYIWNVAESEYTPTEAAIESDEDYKPVFENVFSVKDNGKIYDITMDEGLTAAMKAFEPDRFASYGAAKAMKKLNDLFKALCTGYNPFFMVRNLARDMQDAGFYSTDSATWAKMFPSAWKQIVTNGEIWQQYKALGGSYASMLDYTTGMVKEPKSAAGKLAAKYESLGQAIEAAPRLAEFMTILANKGGSKTVDGVKTGKFTQSDLMEAMLGAADITTNFARGGSVTKALNRYLVPFLNPSVQGFDKFIRNATETRSVKAAGSLILKAALMGIAPALLNALAYRDDDEWDDIPANTKANYYLINAGKWLGDGYWIKIPKGRAIAVLSTAAVYGKEKIDGEDVKFSDVFEVIKSNIAPTDIFNQNIATAWTQAKLTNPDNPGTTWYGGNIESDRLQNYRPEDRYDEKTDELSKAIGKLFKVSPKKVNYLLDQYTGVIGDLLLPLITPATKSSHWLLAAPQAAFTIDTTSTNKTTGEYYDLLDDLKYDANDGDIGAGITRKYVSHAGDEVNDYYQQIRAIQSDENLTKAEKNRLVRALKSQLIERQKEIIAQAEPYREAVSDYLKAHPELSTDNDAAIAEYAELYGITEDQAESRMDAIVYREANREVFGAEYALRTYNADVYDKARAAYAKGVSYETYYDYYFATKEMHADKDENGKSISGSKKAKVVEYINSLDIPPEQKDALYVAAGYTAKSARNQKWNGGSGGSGGRRGRGKRTALKAPTPKAPEIIIPKSGTASSAKAGGTSKTPKVSGNVIADFTKTASGTDIQKAVTQAKRKALKAGNRTVYVEEGSPIDYFLKYGKLPSLK